MLNMATAYRQRLQSFLCVLGLFTLTRTVRADDCRRDSCPQPPTNEYVTFSPKSESYRHGDYVRYSCKTSQGYLFGSHEMKCGTNGEWAGDRATCATPQPITEIWHDSSFHSNLFDGRNDTCSSSGRKAVWEVSTMNGIHGTIVVGIVTTGCSCAGGKLVVEVNKVSCRLEEKNTGDCSFQSEEGFVHHLFKCEAPKKTRKISVEQGGSWHCFKLCEIYIYERPRILCTSDFEICNGGLTNYAHHTNRTVHGGLVSIYCDKGYRLEGSKDLRCDHGSFVHHGEVPKCVPVTCASSPPPIANGSWSDWDASKTYHYGSRLAVTCKSGYSFAGRLNFTECQAEGSWSTANATCLKIEDQETSKGLILPIAVTVASLVIVAVISVLLWLLYFRKKSREKSQGEIAEGIYSEPFYSESRVGIPRKYTSPLPPLPFPTVSAFYSDPKGSHNYYSTGDEEQYREPYGSLSRGKTTLSQNTTACQPDYLKENVVYDQSM